MDLERNAAILQKTDKKIAQKLRAKNAASSLRLTDENKSPAEMVTFFFFQLSIATYLTKIKTRMTTSISSEAKNMVIQLKKLIYRSCHEKLK